MSSLNCSVHGSVPFDFLHTVVGYVCLAWHFVKASKAYQSLEFVRGAPDVCLTPFATLFSEFVYLWRENCVCGCRDV